VFKLVLVLLFALSLNAQELKLLDGNIQAHTEVFGDSTINPETKNITTRVYKDETIESITGEFTIDSSTLTSDNKDRDKHMYEVLKSSIVPTISFNIISIVKVENKYQINGDLKINNMIKKVSSTATINEENGLSITGDFSINLTDFNLEPPTMFFLTVRDQVDIKYSFNFEKGN
jgi:polyisoprenoid-binding protein YceI